MKKVVYNSGTGVIEGLYDTDYNASIPTPNITITLTQYNNVKNNVAGYIVNTGTQLLEAAPSPSGPTLLANAKAIKGGQLNTAYQGALLDGFSSNALGVSHTYRSDDETILLLNSLIAAGATANFYYVSGGILVSASHTLAELQDVLDDFLTARQAIIQNLITKLADVAAASTVPDVEAITW